MAWAISLGSLGLSYLTNDNDKSGVLFLIGLVTGLIGFFLLIACGASWAQLHPNA